MCNGNVFSVMEYTHVCQGCVNMFPFLCIVYTHVCHGCVTMLSAVSLCFDMSRLSGKCLWSVSCLHMSIVV